MIAWGVDGCAGGWIAVRIDGARRDVTIVEQLSSLPTADAAMLYIDIPIGLPETGHRGCDLAARKLLKGAASRVFLGLRRPLLQHIEDYHAANAWAKRDGKGLAKQAFNILSKIAEIDALITPAQQNGFRESHPELIFARLNGGTPLASKHQAAGIEARRAILQRHGFDALDQWLGTLRRKDAKPDDLFDACALALAARDAAEGSARRVDGPELRDAKGLRMEIWY